MRTMLIALSTFAAIVSLPMLTTPSLAGDDTLLWQGTTPTATAHIKDQFGERDILCYPTIRQYPGQPAQQVYRAIECSGDAVGLSDIGMPLNGPPINMQGIHEATHVAVDPKTGKIKLY